MCIEAKRTKPNGSKEKRMTKSKLPKKNVAEIVGPDLDAHDDSERVIGRRVTYHGDEHPYLAGHELVIVAVLRALQDGDRRALTSEDEVHAAGGVTADDRIEVAPFIKEENRFSFVTSDPRAIDLDAFRHLARRSTTH
jgi:hypothetical protein